VPNSSTRPERQGVEILVRGTVQGVGFRPFIYTLAHRLGIAGTVGNTPDGVSIVACGDPSRLRQFLNAIEAEAPPLARITSLDTWPLPVPVAEGGFTILTSTANGAATTAIPPDIALCADCRRELFDPADHRYLYPFINCTNCGPRLSIVETIPYDRPKTSMKHFPMCPACTREYHDPGNRRFHAQPNACPDCGPALFLNGGAVAGATGARAIELAVAALGEGKILALRGLGGFHLAADATSAAAVARLRTRKGRPDKPLAVMVRDLAAAGKVCRINPTEASLLTSPVHPIVLLRPRENPLVAANLHPRIGEIGVMLPYTPLHHLLFRQKNCPELLVMTSGNVSGEPICTANDDAIARLGAIADLFLLHDRDIVTRVDDSVVKVVAGRTLLLRRARGIAPEPLEVPWSLPTMLACGAGLKNTFCLSRGRTLFPSQHLGDLDNAATYAFFRQAIAHYQRLFQLQPTAVACDLHPDYLSSHYAAELGLPLYRVQHHHAHAVAVMAEHGLADPVLAVVLDGTGLGSDGTIWGGEILLAGLDHFQRLGHLSHLPLPGGDAAASEPWRMGLAALFAAGGSAALAPARLPAGLRCLAPEKVRVLAEMLEKKFNSPLSSSCGRLFDAVAALLGLRLRSSYEGQAAMELEALARTAAGPDWLNRSLPTWRERSGVFLHLRHGKWEISSREFVTVLLAGLAAEEAVPLLALRFHTMLIAAIAGLVERLAAATGIRRIVLAGGSMQNSLLLEGLCHSLASFEVYSGARLPVNDGAVSFGQAIIGGLQHVSCDTNAGHPGRG
jgi:hydrogenase maturation protein HypF